METKKGMLAECILALGHLYQMGKCKELEGIMDMVVYLENKIRFKDKEEVREEEETEEIPITNTDFNTAIGTLSSKLDRLMEVTEKRMEENLEVTRQTKELCKELLKEAQAVGEETKHMDS
eukprot:2481944-Heterocapsa_arctica.AAC.1